MAVLFIDGFDHLDVASVSQKWTGSAIGLSGVGGSSALTISATYGRIAGSGMRSTANTNLNSTSGAFVYRTFVNRSTVTIGFAFRYDIWTCYIGNPFLSLMDSATTQIDVRMDSSNRLYVTRNGTTLFTASTGLGTTIWYFIELKMTIHPTTGTVELRVNGVTQGTFAGNTSGSGSSSANQVRLGPQLPATSATGAIDTRFDDFFLLEADSGSGLTDFLGDCRVQTLLPSAAGTTTGMTKTGAAATNWQSVNETTPDTTTYVSSNTAGVYDTYQYSDLAASTNQVYAVAQSFVWRKDDAGFRTGTARVRSGSSEADFATPVTPLSGSYSVQQQIQELNPLTGTAWTASVVNGAEFGPKVG